MEPVTHFLTGACIGRAGFNRTTAYATLVTTLAAEFPDIDIVFDLGGPLVSFQHHRGFTHTLAGVPFNAAIVLAAVYGWHRWRAARGRTTILPTRWGLLYIYGVIAGLSHLLLDFTNNYGLRPFAPFNWRWYSWDIVFIIEPFMLAVLLLGLLMPAVFSLVGQEVA
ncbi:MAG TPA: metal-dependent hydrolase, partial [Terriglobales bacterium]